MCSYITKLKILYGKPIPQSIFVNPRSTITWFFMSENNQYTLINKKMKPNFSMLKIKHPPEMALGGVKAVPHMAGRLMKGLQLSDNLFSGGLSVNHVDSISWDLTASGCAPTSISLTSQASERKRDGEIGRKRWREVNNLSMVLLLYDSFSWKHPSRSDDSNIMMQHDMGSNNMQKCHEIISSLIIFGQSFNREKDDNDSENKVDKDDDNDHYGSIRDQQHYSGTAWSGSKP